MGLHKGFTTQKVDVPPPKSKENCCNAQWWEAGLHSSDRDMDPRDAVWFC